MQGSPDVTCMYGNWSKVPHCIGKQYVLYAYKKMVIYQLNRVNVCVFRSQLLSNGPGMALLSPYLFLSN